jgi:hypothetical protein
MAASPDEVPSREEPRNVVLEGIVGSTAYGLATDDSDIDRLGIFLEPTENFLGLHGVPVKRQSWKQPGDEDRTLHEVGKFCAKVLGGNPTFTELLWLPEHNYVTRSDVGDSLIEMRRAFLAAGPVLHSYFGYATSQFRELEKRGDGSFSSDTRKRTEKHARHMARLLIQGLHAWVTGDIQVDLTWMGSSGPIADLMVDALGGDPGRLEESGVPYLVRTFGEQVATGDIGAAQVLLRQVEQWVDRTRTPLPKEPDKELIDRWLKATRLRQLRR